MSAAPLHGHHDDRQPIPRTQAAVAAVLPPAQRMEFYREMGEADDQVIGGVPRRWWLRAELYRDAEGDRIHAAVQAGTAPGTSAAAEARWRAEGPAALAGAPGPGENGWAGGGGTWSDEPRDRACPAPLTFR
ncbi:hypothetical protein [Kitasatospora phosalacinea]|uniref:Uncharacterized protein n=1 Tax=Kitasatospora phosalacinea TaxID=2065 RepID=A0A9W6PEV5_9ACTN|nr:hypothetical protein [Kitasatospora phosalacinea]GLW53612.1 hypothetical protein Kpho01_16230 [Kitasatospora phosalacinea]